MGKLIDADAAIESLTEYGNGRAVYIGVEEAVRRIEQLPSAQSDVIRCKDCAYCDSDVVDAPYGMTKKIFWCDRLYAGANENLIVEPDNFCSWAERREDANND